MESLFGSSTLGSAAAETGASSSLADFAASSAADTGAATAGTEAGLAAGTGGTLAGGTGEFATGVTASDLAGTTAGTAAAAPGIIDQISNAYNAASPYINTAGKVLQVGNMLKSAVSGAGTPQSGAANTPSTAPYTTSPQPATPAGSQTKQQDYINQQTAYWQQLLSAIGSSLAARPDIQDMIRRQSSLYPA